MSQTQLTIFWSIVIGLVAGVLLFTIVDGIHHRTASMEYGDGQVLMLLLDMYPDTTIDARNTLIKYLGDGYITKWEYDVIMRQATRAVFYDRGDVSMGKHFTRNPC